MGGYIGGAQSCSDFAVDGFGVWGIPVLYRLIDGAGAAAASIKYNATNPERSLMTLQALATARPFTSVAGGLEYNAGAGADVAGVNLAQMRAIAYIYKDTDIFNCFLLTGSEYFAESGFICIGAESAI